MHCCIGPLEIPKGPIYTCIGSMYTLQKQNGCCNPARVISVAYSESDRRVNNEVKSCRFSYIATITGMLEDVQPHYNPLIAGAIVPLD